MRNGCVASCALNMEDKHHPDSSNNVQMGIRHKQGMPMQSQFEQAILDVYDFCIKEKEAGVPIIPLNHFSKRVCELLKISDSSVKRVLRKRENGEPLAPLKRTRNRKSPVTNIDDYTRDAIARKVHAYNYQETSVYLEGVSVTYVAEIFKRVAHDVTPTLQLLAKSFCILCIHSAFTFGKQAPKTITCFNKHFTMSALLEECKADLGFKGCEKSLRAILQKQLGFVFKKVDNKLRLEQKKVAKKKPKGKMEVVTQTQHQAPQQQQQKLIKKVKKVKMNSVPVQTQTIASGQVQEMMGHQEHMGTTVMHTIPINHGTHQQMVDIQMRHQQTETIEHMALTGLVAHRANVIENMAMQNRNEMMAQQQQQQQQQQQHHRGQHPMEGITVINDYRKQ